MFSIPLFYKGKSLFFAGSESVIIHLHGKWPIKKGMKPMPIVKVKNNLEAPDADQPRTQTPANNFLTILSLGHPFETIIMLRQ